MNESLSSTPNRRTFAATTAAGTVGLMVLKPETVFGSKANGKILIGSIGAGGRAQFISKKFLQNVGDDIQLVAAHDYFEDRLKQMQLLFDIDAKRCYTGLNGYQELLASEVDAVMIMSPPYFHPIHADAAVEAGKHVWLCKPVATDVAGALQVKSTGRKAQGKVAFLVDFQSRNSPHFMEAVKRVHEGAIGELISGEAFNQFGAAGHPKTEGLTKVQARLRAWGTDPVLSGDCIVEQAVHAVDIANWIVNTHPTKAYGTGGLKARLKAGTNWDHFIITYWYGDGPVVDLNCSQFMRGYNNLGARLFGAKGTVHAHYRAVDWGDGPVKITGDNPYEGTEHDNTWDIGVDRNCKDFVHAIRTGEYMNHAEYGADSTLTAILGRTAAYENRVVTWDEMMQKKEAFDLQLNL